MSFRARRRAGAAAEIAVGDGVERPPVDHLELLEVDGHGLERTDRALLHAIVDRFEGGPVGLDTLSAAVGEERDTIEDVYEPFLIQEGFLARTPRGRVATALAYRHFGREQGTPAAPAQGRLL